MVGMVLCWHAMGIPHVYGSSREAMAGKLLFVYPAQDERPSESTSPLVEIREHVVAPDGASGDLFGSAMKTLPGYLFVGAAHADSDDMEERGAVYVFERSGGKWV